MVQIEGLMVLLRYHLRLLRRQLGGLGTEGLLEIFQASHRPFKVMGSCMQVPNAPVARERITKTLTGLAKLSKREYH